MRIGDCHLTYCTNVHPGEQLPEVLDNLERYVTEVKALVSPTAPFAVGLWLAHDAALALQNGQLPRLIDTLQERGLYVPTLNGFPFGAFHGTRVKERVYEPDWRDPKRREHSVRLARILAELVPSGVRGSISTLPGGFKPALRDAGDHARIASALLSYAVDLHQIEQDTGKHIMLGLEPEPCCMLETIEEAVTFFGAHLHDERAIASVAQLAGFLVVHDAERRVGGRAHAGCRHLAEDRAASRFVGIAALACELQRAFEVALHPVAALVHEREVDAAQAVAAVAARLGASLRSLEAPFDADARQVHRA